MRGLNLYRGKIVYVHEGVRFDAVVDLGFYVFLRVPVQLDGLDLPRLNSSSVEERDLARKAKECSMKLLLSRQVLMETFKPVGQERVWLCNLFLTEDTKYTQLKIDLLGESYIDVLKYMRMLADGGFDTGMVDLLPLV